MQNLHQIDDADEEGDGVEEDAQLEDDECSKEDDDDDKKGSEPEW